MLMSIDSLFLHRQILFLFLYFVFYSVKIGRYIIYIFTSRRGTCILFRRADTLGNECLDFFFSRQLDVVFLHKQIRIQATCCILDDRFPVVGTQKQAYGRIVICGHHFVLVIVQVHIQLRSVLVVELVNLQFKQEMAL